MMQAFPVSIITGFLGSGKTTLLNRVLQHPELKGSLVIINEFGEVSIDHLLVSTPTENMRLLMNGCLCCAVRGELVDTLTDVARQRNAGAIPPFDRVLIETSGLADPVPIVQTLVADEKLSNVYRLDTVVSAIDAVHVMSQLAVHREAVKQIAVSDVLVVTKTDLAEVQAVRDAEARVRTINPGADILRAMRGEIDPGRLFNRARHPDGTDFSRWLGQEMQSTASGTHGKAAHTGDVHTFTLYHDEPVTRSGLVTWLSMLAGFRGPQLLRVKGLINVEGEPVVIHAVQTVIHEPIKLNSWPGEDRRSRLVFIVRGLTRAALEPTLAAFSMPEPPRTPQIDPAAYARFVDAATRFIGNR